MCLKGLTFAWVSPSGRVISTDDELDMANSHNELAQCILRDMWKLSTKEEAWTRCHLDTNEGYPYEVLEARGWIRLHGWANPKFIIPYDRIITKRQEETILDWCIENNIKYDDAISK